MKQYRTRPVVVEAVQIDEHNIFEVAAWCGGIAPAQGTNYTYIELWVGPGKFIIGSIGEWMVKDEQGNFSSCKPDIFETTYEPM